jgi:hypothetical protein
MIPRSIADTTAAVRSSTPSLPKICSRWVLTVASLMNRRAATSALLEPLATSSSTSISRPVSASSARTRMRCTSRVATTRG